MKTSNLTGAEEEEVAAFMLEDMNECKHPSNTDCFYLEATAAMLAYGYLDIASEFALHLRCDDPGFVPVRIKNFLC